MLVDPASERSLAGGVAAPEVLESRIEIAEVVMRLAQGEMQARLVVEIGPGIGQERAQDCQMRIVGLVMFQVGKLTVGLRIIRADRESTPVTALGGCVVRQLLNRDAKVAPRRCRATMSARTLFGKSGIARASVDCADEGTFVPSENQPSSRHRVPKVLRNAKRAAPTIGAARLYWDV
jgi:hypothetical protein